MGIAKVGSVGQHNGAIAVVPIGLAIAAQRIFEKSRVVKEELRYCELAGRQGITIEK